MTLVTAANLRLMSAARPRTGDPVADADHQTTMADLRAAICLAAGVSPDDIGPGGYDYSPAAYASVRASWLRHIRQWGIGLWDSNAEQVQARWAEVRPDLVSLDESWRETGAALHRQDYPDGCPRAADDTWPCVLCSPYDWVREA